MDAVAALKSFMANTKTFPLAIVLSATTGRLLCEIEKMYDIFNHVTGDKLFTHALPRAFRFGAPLIKTQFPELEVAEKPENLARLDGHINVAKTAGQPVDAAIASWLLGIQQTHNLQNEYAIASHADAWIRLNPLEELAAVMT